MNHEELNLIATKTFPFNFELYKIVDFLNKNLKNNNLIFGIKQDSEGESMTINIYKI